MYFLIGIWESVRDFQTMGGDVLFLIGVLTFVMWALILERVWYFRTEHQTRVNDAMAIWEARKERTSWHAHKIRKALISQVSLKMTASLPLIKTCMALCPLMGLLGTVTGMIEVFDVMAITGSGNARSMAAGVSKATIPTMAGMVAAISGIAGDTYLTRVSNSEKELLEDHLTMDH